MPIRDPRPTPISARQTFALALDLAIRRDPLQSLLVPLLVRGPWILALALLAPADPESIPRRSLALASLAGIGDYVASLVVGAMLRLRARSVFRTPRDARPAPAQECYVQGARRIPWLFITEAVRNFVLAIAASVILIPPALVVVDPESAAGNLAHHPLTIVLALLFAVPSVFVLYRLGVATEAVVLDERDLGGAFQRSFGMMRRHLVSWGGLIVVSGLMVLGPLFVVALLSLGFPALAESSGLALFALVLVPIWSVIQYAWTFFYLRLLEDDRSRREAEPVPSEMVVGGPVEAVPIDEPTAPDDILPGRVG
jgi:hypothetical protein